jgi:two-component system, NarL family, nitrate/nitrite response regulator NarL
MLEGRVNAEIPAGESNGDENNQVLSPREQEVIRVISLGLTNREAAEQLSVSVHAVKFHLASIYRKLDVSNRTEAVVAFLSAR